MASGDDAFGLSGAYGRSRVVLMAVDPLHVHVYWEITPEDRERAHKRLDPLHKHEPPIWVLRFHDVTMVEFDGSNAHSYFNVPVDLAAKNWYVELWSSDKTYYAELGPRSDAGFVAACRSNFEYVPRAEPSPRYEPRWQSVPDAPAPPPAPDEPAHGAGAEPETALATAALRHETARDAPAAAEQQAAREVLTTATPHVPPHSTARPMPAFARQGRSFSVSLQRGSGSGSAGGPR